MKLITHLRPHLDDICGLWLLRRYLPEAKDAEIGFIATNERGGDVVADPSVIHVGVGRGMFDEHKGDIGECATTLVFKHVRGKANLAPEESRAVERLVEWVRLEDTGRLNTIPYRSFAVPSILEGRYQLTGDDSAAETEFGFLILDALLETQRNEVHIEDAWAGRVEFDSRFGKAVGLRTGARQADRYAYSHGFPVAVIVDPAGGYHSVRADADSDVDLTSVSEKLKEVDPKASWYFHHSKKMLICGGDHAPGATPSSLTFEQLMDLLR